MLTEFSIAEKYSLSHDAKRGFNFIEENSKSWESNQERVQTLESD